MGWIKNARFVSLLLLSLLLSACEGRRPWNVLLVTLDTTRADFLGCYGKDSTQTPTLDRLAAQGFLFEQTAARDRGSTSF